MFQDTANTALQVPASTNSWPAWLVRELRSDQAGETGAVAIYQGILAVSRNADILEFARNHLETERSHLAAINAVLPSAAHTRLLPMWRFAGFLTGALPSLFGPAAVFATIDAVETFVDRHYAAQIQRLDEENGDTALRALLERCRLDEVAHRDEARQSLEANPSVAVRLWCALVSRGSAAAVAVARHI